MDSWHTDLPDVGLLDGSQRHFGILRSVGPVSNVRGNTIGDAGGAYHKKTPTLSTCAVARKSPVGEKETLDATLVVRKPSINRPEGTSKVRMMESREVVISHRESGEKVCCLRV